MSLLDSIRDVNTWERFYEYKTSLACPKALEKKLRDYIDRREFIPVCEDISAGKPFPLPERKVISKLYTKKKRIVYTYPERENMVLKLLTYLMLRKYDGIFPDNLYSFRPERTAKSALVALRRTKNIGELYSYKVDVSDYFNSIDVDLLLPMLDETLKDDTELFRFLSALLKEERVLDRGLVVTEKKGIMAGTPIAAFYANLFLKDLDALFLEKNIPYARYSDDIIIFAKMSWETEELAALVRAFLKERGLAVNPDKECFSSPDEGWTFLGFHCRGNVIDIAPVSVEKLKKKMRRKTRALMRWSRRNGIEGEKAAKAFIRVFNRKLFENPIDNELTWTYWFFPVINTADSLNEIDRYAQECIRYLISGKHTKARFNVRYEDIKALGYKSLVHAYYAHTEEERNRRGRSDPDGAV